MNERMPPASPVDSVQKNYSIDSSTDQSNIIDLGILRDFRQAERRKKEEAKRRVMGRVAAFRPAGPPTIQHEQENASILKFTLPDDAS